MIDSVMFYGEKWSGVANVKNKSDEGRLVQESDLSQEPGEWVAHADVFGESIPDLGNRFKYGTAGVFIGEESRGAGVSQ